MKGFPTLEQVFRKINTEDKSLSPAMATFGKSKGKSKKKMDIKHLGIMFLLAWIKKETVKTSEKNQKCALAEQKTVNMLAALAKFVSQNINNINAVQEYINSELKNPNITDAQKAELTRLQTLVNKIKPIQKDMEAQQKNMNNAHSQVAYEKAQKKYLEDKAQIKVLAGTYLDGLKHRSHQAVVINAYLQMQENLCKRIMNEDSNITGGK